MCEFIMWKPGSQWQKQLASLDLGFLAYLLISLFTPSTAVPFIKELILLMQVNPLFIAVSLSLFLLSTGHIPCSLSFLTRTLTTMCRPMATWSLRGILFAVLAFLYLSTCLSPSLYPLVGSPNKGSCLLLVQHLILNMVFPLSIWNLIDLILAPYPNIYLWSGFILWIATLEKSVWLFG